MPAQKYKLLSLTDNKFAKVDPDDYARLSSYAWAYSRKGSVTTKDKGRSLTLGQAIMKPCESLCVIPLNGDPLDFRRSNLAIVSGSHRRQHAGITDKKTKTSRFKGVHWWKSGRKWMARIHKDGREYFLGYFHDEEQAALTYDAKATQFYGSTAYQNFGNQIPKHSHKDKLPPIHRIPQRSRPYTKSRSGYKGVHSNHAGRGKPWLVQLKFKGRMFHLGGFDDPIAAAHAYDKKAQQLYGAGCYLNFPAQNVMKGVVNGA